ncbi:MAG: DUF1211 domain-containing protein [Cyclobacteriaceae bacterium]|nr:DUF1211 domain-containing protein [Cyclobacteriaceae bacterium]
MIREAASKYLEPEPGFRYRGKEPGRLENFSDAVFGMAITLLLISTSPPANFDELKRFTYELFPFLACITLIVLIWHEHYIFFQRYGLRNGKMITLNTLFLVIILFYVYPLKFLTQVILVGPLAYITGNEILVNEIKNMIHARDIGELMIIYGIGATSVFLVLALMYRYALQQAEVLGLNEVERFDTRMSLIANLLMALVPFISLVVAFFLRHSFWAGPIAGFTYFLYTPIMFGFHRRVEKRRNLLLQSQEQTPGGSGGVGG